MTWTIKDRQTAMSEFGTYDNTKDLIADLKEMIEHNLKHFGESFSEEAEFFEIWRSDDVNFLVEEKGNHDLAFRNCDTWEYEDL